MPGSVYHVFTNAVADGTNTSIVRPSDWNSSHALTLNAAGSEISGAFGNGGGVSFGLSADGKVTAAAPAGVPSPVNFSAGTTSGDLGSVVFSNSGGVSFGLNGSTITATVKTDYLTTARASTDAIGLNTAQTNVTWTANSSGLSLNAGGYAGTGFTSTTTAGTDIKATNNTAGLSMAVPAYLTTSVAQTNQTVGLYALGNTTQNSSTTLDARTLSFNGIGGITVGYSNGSIQLSGPQTAAQTNQSIGLYGVGNTTQNSSTTLDARTLSFRGNQDITVGFSNGSVQLSVNVTGAQSNQTDGFYAVGNTTQNSSTTLDARTVSFGGRGIVTVGYSNGTIQISATEVPQTNQTLGLYGLGNTTQNSSTTLDARTVSLNGLGAMTVGYSNGSVQLSAPATSSIVGTSGISVSSNGSTISVQEVPWSQWIVPQDGITIAGSAQAASSVSIFPFYVPRAMAFSHIKLLGSFSYASAANTSSASQAYSASIVLYTRNASTLSSLWSGKQNSNSFFQSNSTTALAGVRGINVTGLATTLPPDQYWAAVHFSTTNSGTGGNTTALGASVSMVVAVSQATAAMQADNWNGGATNESRGLFLGQGLYATGATRGTIAFSDAAFSQTGNSATLAECVLNFQNWTVF